MFIGIKASVARLLPRNQFARSVSVLAGGTTAGQAIIVLASPVLTRLYSPEDFGLLAVFTALLAIVSVVASLRYQLAIPLPESDEEAAHVTVLSLMVVVGVTVLTAVAVFAFGEAISVALNTAALAHYLWLLPVGVLLTGTYQVFNYWAIRTKAFPAIARTKLTQSASMVTVQIAAAALGPVALLVGRIFGQAAGTTSLGWLAIRERWSEFRKVRPAGVRGAANRYRRFPIYSTWAGAFNTGGRELPPLLFAALFNPAVAGIYMLAHYVLAMPMTMIGKAIADVFLSQAAVAKREANLAPLVATVHDKLAQIAMPPALVLMLAGPQIFDLVFGQEWRQAGEFAQWMAPWVYLVFITSPLSALFVVLEKQAHGMFFHGTLMVTRIFAITIGAALENVALAIALFATGSALCWSASLFWIVIQSGNRAAEVCTSTGRALTWGLVLILPLITANVLPSAEGTSFLGLIVTSVLILTRYSILARQVE